MGSGSSSNFSGPIKPVDEQTVRMMLPVYFVDGKVAATELDLAEKSWERITSSSGAHFLRLKDDEVNPLKFGFAVEWFHTSFYERLFDVHPVYLSMKHRNTLLIVSSMSRAMFRDLKTQGHFLVALFSFIFKILEDEAAFHKKLLQLADSHCKKGVKAIEYGIVGEVMFWTLRKCLGEEYTTSTHKAWVKIFSNMLAVIVPVAVAHELASGEAQDARLEGSARTSNYTFAGSAAAGGGIVRVSSSVFSRMGNLLGSRSSDNLSSLAAAGADAGAEGGGRAGATGVGAASGDSSKSGSGRAHPSDTSSSVLSEKSIV